MALHDAYESAMEEHIRWNLPMHFWEDGKVVEVSVEEVRQLLAESRARRGQSLPSKVKAALEMLQPKVEQKS